MRWRNAIMAAALALGACATRAEPSLPSAAAIDAEARRLMASQDVKGMAIAVIEGGEVYPEMVRFVLGETAMPWWWEYNPG